MNRTMRFSVMAFLCLLSTTTLRSQPSDPPKKNTAADQTRSDEPIDFERARHLLRKQQNGEKLTPAEDALLEKAKAARRRGAGRGNQGTVTPRDKTGLKPLTEMTADDRYKGQDGGLYGEGRNTPPESHRKAALAQVEKIKPLDAKGNPADDGRVVLISISMSNATQEFSIFKRIADANPSKSPKLTIVDCAQGGQAMAEWVDPDAGPWQEADRRIEMAGISPQQVQIAWIKLANRGPQGDLEEHGRKLQKDTLAVIQNAKARFPNLQIVYLASRIYGGYSNGPLNPEPYAYESAFAARWLIQDQIKGEAGLNYDPSRGPVKAPLLLWGPYFWADGVTPRKSDNLVWDRSDLGPDGTHPSNSGREKVAQMLLKFFLTDETAKPWFAK